MTLALKRTLAYIVFLIASMCLVCVWGVGAGGETN